MISDMKRFLICLSVLAMSVLASFAEKQRYITQAWRQPRSDTLLYAESDTENK